MTRRVPAVAVLLSVLAVSACTGPAVDPASAPTTSTTSAGAEATYAEDVEREECPPRARGDQAARRAVTGVARCAVIAYTEFSFRDRDHRAWIDRVERYGTETFVAELRELFGPDVSAEIAIWKDLVEQRTVARTVITSAEAARSDDTWTVTVETEAERRTKADPDWEAYGEPQAYQVTLVQVRDDWRVSDIS